MSQPRMRLLFMAVTVLATASLLISRTPQALDQDEWALYRTRFITTEGRVLDSGNAGVSHSEGQGYGMLLAVAFDDPGTFERLWRWTEAHLQVRDDALFAWRFDPRGGRPAADLNSAADGDLLIAWALAEAGERWRVADYRAAAGLVAREVLASLVRSHAGGPILLPGSDGFVREGIATVNLSYWLWPAFPVLERVAPSPLWDELSQSGTELLQTARFGAYELPPDWLELDAWPHPSPLFEPVYGYNAIRIPLHLVWGGMARPELLAPFLRFAAAHKGRPPAAVDLVTGEASPERLSAGGQAILALAEAAVTGRPAALPRVDERMDYFSASLLLLAKVANVKRVEG